MTNFITLTKKELIEIRRKYNYILSRIRIFFISRKYKFSQDIINSGEDFKVGETIFDDLTCRLHKVLFVLKKGIIIDSKYLKGGRHDWEVSKIEKRVKG